jgi:hypothetical protein
MILQEVVVGRVVLAELVGLVVLVDRGGLADPENPEELVGLVELVNRGELADPENPEELVGLVKQADQANRAALAVLAVAKPASLGWK